MLPALFTRMSSRPNESTAASIRAWPPAAWDTSLVSADCLPTGVDDLGGDGGGRLVVASVALPGASEVVDDDAGTPLGEEEGVGPPDTAPGPGDGGHTSVEIVRTHQGDSLL